MKMIKRIFKYTIRADDRFEIEMPKDAEILTVQTQYDQPQLWALVNPDAPREKRVFRLAGTGHPINFDMGSEYKYINSFQLNDGALVFHLFEWVSP